jgi:hypothetical protein
VAGQAFDDMVVGGVSTVNLMVAVLMPAERAADLIRSAAEPGA